ncbi:hypothetical protein G6011_11291 [Alternaria panax]|uniref:Uncharacterized protein n=1 Tax=Alternaria panax TaxID=48097 RepID=A0AAD4IDF9_9PLEO|nr:hypothetical protein G6011_11291 [Alternaria panax]
MASQNHKFTGPIAEMINKISRAVKEADTSTPTSLRNHRRYLYLVERLGNEMRAQILIWQRDDPRAETDNVLFAAVDKELGLHREHHDDDDDDDGTTPLQLGTLLEASSDMQQAPPPHRHQRGVTPQQTGARFADFPEMLPAPSFRQTARKLGFATPSSPPTSAARPDRRAATEDKEEHADAFPTLDPQTTQLKARVEGRGAYVGSNQSTAVDYPSSPSKEGE